MQLMFLMLTKHLMLDSSPIPLETFLFNSCEMVSSSNWDLKKVSIGNQNLYQTKRQTVFCYLNEIQTSHLQQFLCHNNPTLLTKIMVNCIKCFT